MILREAADFLGSLPPSVMDKVYYNIHRIASGERNAELFKKISGSEIWEFRTKYDKMTYRLFAFWDKEGETLVVATHGMIKKTQKTPLGEIAKAERIRKEYFEDKKKGD